MSVSRVSFLNDVSQQSLHEPASKYFLKFINHAFQKYTIIIGIPKKIYHLAKEVFSFLKWTKKCKSLDFGLKGINLGFILFGAPIHVYKTYTDSYKLIKAVCKLDFFKFVEYSLKFIVDLADIGDDVSSVATILSTFGYVSKTAIAWAGTLGTISGAFQSLALILAGIDFYRVHKFQNGFREATKEGKSYEDLLQFLDQNKKLTKKVMGMKTNELLEVLKTKEIIDDQEDAKLLMKGKVCNKIWVARAGLMKAQHKQVIRILTSRVNVQMWTTRVALVAGAISLIAAGILFLSPLLFPLVAPTIASVGTGFCLMTTTMFAGKFFIEKAVDLKFRKDIYTNVNDEIPPIIIANPITKEDVENVYGSHYPKDVEKSTTSAISKDELNQPQISLDELQDVMNRKVLLRGL